MKIDEGCVKLITLFNELGLKTRYSCEGHGVNTFYIQFDNCVTDEQIECFLKKYINQYNHSMFSGKLSKWCRVVCGEIKYNWRYEVLNKDLADLDYLKIIKYLEYRKRFCDNQRKENVW